MTTRTYIKHNDSRFDLLLPSTMIESVRASAEAAAVSAAQWVRLAIREKLDRDNAE